MNPCLKDISYIVLTSEVVVQNRCEQFLTIFCWSSDLASLWVLLYMASCHVHWRNWWIAMGGCTEPVRYEEKDLPFKPSPRWNRYPHSCRAHNSSLRYYKPFQDLFVAYHVCTNAGLAPDYTQSLYTILLASSLFDLLGVDKDIFSMPKEQKRPCTPAAFTTLDPNFYIIVMEG